MDIAATGSQALKGDIQIEEIVLVEAAGSLAVEDVLGELLGILRAHELLVVGSTDVDEGANGFGAVGGLEGRVVDGVTVDLADIEVLLNFGHLIRDNAVGHAPDPLRRIVMVCQLLPVGSLDEGHDTTRRLRSAAMVLTGSKGRAISGWDLSYCSSGPFWSETGNWSNLFFIPGLQREQVSDGR